MQFPARFADLPEHAFPRLRTLLAGTRPGGPELAMTIGEPQHPVPFQVAKLVGRHVAEFGRYPPNDGAPELLEAIAGWIARRHGVTVDPATRILALNGTREGLFAAALALSPEDKRGARPVVLVPNPFYQAYGAGALATGAELVPVPATAETGFLPDYAALPPALLDRVTLAYLCSPANPQGAVAGEAHLARLLALAERHDFRLLCDECYSEMMEPKPGVPPTTRHLQELVQTMRAEKIGIILASVYYDPRHAQFLAQNTGAQVVPLAHQVGSRPGTDPDYLGLIDYNIRQLVAVLGNGRSK